MSLVYFLAVALLAPSSVLSVRITAIQPQTEAFWPRRPTEYVTSEEDGKLPAKYDSRPGTEIEMVDMALAKRPTSGTLDSWDSDSKDVSGPGPNTEIEMVDLASIRAKPEIEASLASEEMNLPIPFFLNSSDLTAVRHGAARRDIHLWSGDNSIRYLPNADRFMPRLFEVISAAGKDDFIYMTCWELDVDMLLHPRLDDPVASEQSRLINVIRAASDRGVTIRMLYTYGLAQSGAPATCKKINDIVGPGTCIADPRHNHRYIGSSHMKTWMIRLQGHLVAFVGSMDIATGRWDTAQHLGREDPVWKLEPQDPVRQWGWHGTTYEVRGGAARDVLATFLGRWNDPVQYGDAVNISPLPDTEASLLVGGRALHVPVVLMSTDSMLSNLPVQVVRTFGCRDTQEGWFRKPIYQLFAPHGEYSYAAMWFKAVRNARRYIFVADQFVFFDEAMAAVVEAAHHLELGVIIVTNSQTADFHIDSRKLGLHAEIPVPVWPSVAGHYQYKAITEAIEKRDPSGALLLKSKVRMFMVARQSRNDAIADNLIYDHEKTLLIDDALAVVGSAGVERTGFTNDAELSLAVHSSAFATDLRRRMFAELLLLRPEDPKLATPESAWVEWMRQADDAQQRVRHYTPSDSLHVSERPIASLIYNMLEPDGRCTDRGHASQWRAALSAGSSDV